MDKFTEVLAEPIKSKMIEFLIQRVRILKKKKRRNGTSVGRLVDLIQLIVADLPINDPPLYIQRKIKELKDERQSNGQL